MHNDESHADCCLRCGIWYDPFVEGERGLCNECYNFEIAKFEEQDNANDTPVSAQQ